jgi:tetratricopeptide (TPR) repeat protein
VAAVFTTLFAGISTTTWQAIRASREATRARAAEMLAAERYRIAKASMDRYVTIVMEDPKLQYGFDPLRNSLLMEAVPLYEPLVGQNPETPEECRAEALTLLRLGTLHAALANHRAAVANYSRAIQMLHGSEGDAARERRIDDTASVPLPGHPADELTPEIGRFYTDTMRHLHAIAPRPEDDPEYFAMLATTQAVLGDCLARAGRWKEAAQQFQQSLELSPGSFERSAKAATLFLACDQIDEYERLCRKTLPLAHTFPDQWIFLLSSKGTVDWASVIEHCNRRFADLEFPSLTHTVAAIQIGCAEYRRGRVDRAIEWLTEYADRVDGDYNPVRAHIVLAMALHNVGRTQEALRSLSHARLLMEEYDTRRRGADLGLRWRGWLQSRILYQEAVDVLDVQDERGVSPEDAYAQLLNQMRNEE